MKQLQELIKETLVAEDAKGEYPNFPYISGKDRITQIAISLKLQKKIVEKVGGDYFVDKDFKEKYGHLHPFKSSKDNGKTFLDQNILNPDKFVEPMKASQNTTYSVRIDTKNVFLLLMNLKQKNKSIDVLLISNMLKNNKQQHVLLFQFVNTPNSDGSSKL